MAAGLIMGIGLLVLAGGIVFLVRKKKVPGLIMTIAGGVVALFGLIIVIGLIVTADLPDAVPEGEQANTLIDVAAMDGLTATEDKITYITEYVTIVIEADNEDHSGDTVSGKTEDGIEWSTTNKDGTEDIHMKVDDKEVTAKVETKQSSENASTEKADAGKAAEAVAALIDTGYRKGKDDYNHNYAIWYVEPAECLVYYPAQLELEMVYEDNTAIFKDKKSKAQLKISLDENNFSCMDDVESLIANTEFNKVLASGTDWFSCETKGKTQTEFSMTGLGEKFAVNVDLTYENKYDFVFEELRSLIKCKFVEGGKWVSNEVRDTTGKAVPALQNAYANGMKWKLTQWYFADGDYIMIYPDIFSKMYYKNGDTFFTDPATGAYIKTFKQEYGSSIDALAIDYGLVDYTRIDQDIIRGYKDTEDYYKEYHFVVIRDALEYHTIMYVPYSYDYLYEAAAAELSLKVPGDDVDTFEMQDLYFKDYNCFVTVPLQFKYESGGGNDYYYYDSFNGLDLHIRFSEIPASKNTGNIFDIFDVTAEDYNLIIGENIVKWRNDDGLFLGGQGNKTACYVEIVAVDAERAYLKCWDRFNIRFEEAAKARSIVDEVKKDVKVAKIKEETIQEKTGESVKPTGNTTQTTNDSGDNENIEPVSEEDAEPTEGAPINGETPIVAEAVNHELPQNDDWADDGVQNVVLWYKSYNDYKFMCSDAGSWFKSEVLGAYRSHSFKTDLLTYMECILFYNEYEIEIDPAWISSVGVPGVDAILEEWYYESNPAVGSMMGDDITSVFEAYCRVLNIEVPDYVSNAMEPSVLDDATDTSSQSSSSQQNVSTYDDIDISSLAGRWEPDYILERERYYDLTENGEYTEYMKGVDGIVSKGTFKVKGRNVYLFKDGSVLNHYNTWRYYPDEGMMVTKYYQQKLYRIGESASTGSGDGNSYSADIDDGYSDEIYYVWDERFDGPLSGINLFSYETTTEPLFERVYNSFNMDAIREAAYSWGYGRSGNASAISYNDEDMAFIIFEQEEYGNDLTSLMSRLESLGLSCVGKGSFEKPRHELFWDFAEDYLFLDIEYVEYYGTVSGYEDYGPLHVVIADDGGSTEVSWLFENYSSFPIAKGEMYVDESFVHFCQGFLGKQVGGTLDPETIWFVCQRASGLMNGPELNLPDIKEPYNYDMSDLYYVIVGDDTDSEWFAVLAFYLTQEDMPVYIFKDIEVWENGDWTEAHWRADDGEWIVFE